MSRISSKELVGQIMTSLLHLYTENEAKAIAYRCLDLGWDCSATDILMQKPVEISVEWNAKLGRLQTGEPLQYVMGFEFLEHALSEAIETYIEFYNHPEKYRIKRGRWIMLKKKQEI